MCTCIYDTGGDRKKWQTTVVPGILGGACVHIVYGLAGDYANTLRRANKVILPLLPL